MNRIEVYKLPRLPGTTGPLARQIRVDGKLAGTWRPYGNNWIMVDANSNVVTLPDDPKRRVICTEADRLEATAGAHADKLTVEATAARKVAAEAELAERQQREAMLAVVRRKELAGPDLLDVLVEVMQYAHSMPAGLATRAHDLIARVTGGDDA